MEITSFITKEKEYKTSSEFDRLSYEDLHKILDELNNKASRIHNQEKLKKTELDHIIWYCYKSFKA